METDIQTNTVKSPSPEREMMTDIYKEILEGIAENINTCRGRNREIGESLSFVLNNRCDNCENVGDTGLGEDKKPVDDLLNRLNLIKGLLGELKKEQVNLIERTRY
jgi:hypothetical protein